MDRAEHGTVPGRGGDSIEQGVPSSELGGLQQVATLSPIVASLEQNPFLVQPVVEPWMQVGPS